MTEEEELRELVKLGEQLLAMAKKFPAEVNYRRFEKAIMSGNIAIVRGAVAALHRRLDEIKVVVPEIPSNLRHILNENTPTSAFDTFEV